MKFECGYYVVDCETKEGDRAERQAAVGPVNTVPVSPDKACRSL